MQNPPGVFIVLEGADGSGKGTQFNLLKARLEAVGHDVEVFDFPRYDQPSSHFVREYLNGSYGKATEISPYTASLFFALDRYEAAQAIKQALAAGKVVMSNRFVGSNMAHQGSKFSNPAEQRGFFVWEDNLEFQLLGIPRPNLSLFLRVPAEISFELIGKKNTRSYTTKTRDEHEADIGHLRRSVATYDLLCQLFPNDFRVVECVKDNELLGIADINNLIWGQIQPLLPSTPAKIAHAVTISLDQTRPPKEKIETPQLKSAASALKTRLSLATIFDCEAAQPGAVHYSMSWAKNNYEFYLPPELSKKAKQKYEQLVIKLVASHKSMDNKLKSAGLKSELSASALPLAALYRVQIPALTPKVGYWVDSLAKSHNPESKSLAAKLDSDGTLRPGTAGSEPEPIDNIIARLAAQRQPQDTDADKLQLLEVWPRNEFALLRDALYPASNLPREQLEAKLDSWNYQQKYEALQAVLATDRVSLAEQARYKFDVIADRLSLLELRTLGIASELILQPPTLGYGFSLPEAIESSTASDEYQTCLDLSRQLYDMLLATGHDHLLVYGTLAGHKSRAQFSCTLKDLDKLGKLTNQDLAARLMQKVAEAHPILSQKPAAAPAKRPSSGRKHNSNRRRRKNS